MRAKFNLEKDPVEHVDQTKKTVQSLFKQQKRTPRMLPHLPPKMRSIMIGIVGCLVLIGIGAQLVSMIRTSSSEKEKAAPAAQSPTPLSKEAVQGLVNRVGKHMVLPEETPQIVAITNVDSLKKQQVFFALAQNGDQLLVYPSKVILYRPSTDQVVDVAQIRTNPVGQPIASPSGILR